MRKNGVYELFVVLNFSAVDVSVAIPGVNGRFREILSSSPIDISNRLDVHLQPWGYLVFEKK
jgi:hypothetical protein